MRFQGFSTLSVMKQLIELFASRTPDIGTLNDLKAMIGSRDDWHKAHDLFQRIRRKNLQIQDQKDAKLQAQYNFEEMCAKTIYNLSHQPAPFDADSPFWIIPSALSAARYFEIDERTIIEMITPQEKSTQF